MFGLGGKLAIGMGIAMLVMAGGFWVYYKSSQSEIRQLVANNATLAANVDTLQSEIIEQNQSIIKLEQSRASDQKTILELSEKFNDARSEVAKLREKFSKHDLNMLSLAKPGLIERIINKGTAAEGKEFVDLTAPRKEVSAEQE